MHCWFSEAFIALIFLRGLNESTLRFPVCTIYIRSVTCSMEDDQATIEGLAQGSVCLSVSIVYREGNGVYKQKMQGTDAQAEKQQRK